MKNTIYTSIVLLFLVAACGNSKPDSNDQQTSKKEAPQDLKGLSKAYFASGCFWCVEAVFEEVNGVVEVVSGYAGGNEKNPTYEQVSAGATSHAEAVEVYYDTTKVDFKTLVVVFFGSHDPTTLNQQGPDRGTQYRSIAFYNNVNEQKIIESYIEELETKNVFENKIVTEVKPIQTFYKAEEYHQDYERNNPSNPYIQKVSIPRLERFEAKYPELLKHK